MRSIALISILFAAALLALWPIGCGMMDGDNSMEAPRLLAAYPADGDSLVPADTTCFLAFDRGMDRASCERSFHLHMGDHDGSWEAMKGAFHWSAGGDTMFFDPRDMMEHDSDYTIHIEEGMMGGMGGRNVRMAAHFFHGFAGGMGHDMMDSGDELTEGEWHFRTAP